MATNDATFCNAAHVLRRLLTARPISKKHHTLYLALATLLMQWLLWSYVMLVLFEHRLHRHIQRLAPVLEHRRHSGELESSAHLCLTARPGSRRSAAPPPAASARGRRPCTWSFSAAACAPSRRASSLTSRGKGQCVRDGRAGARRVCGALGIRPSNRPANSHAASFLIYRAGHIRYRVQRIDLLGV